MCTDNRFARRQQSHGYIPLRICPGKGIGHMHVEQLATQERFCEVVIDLCQVSADVTAFLLVW
jgi:hypothetical protein